MTKGRSSTAAKKKQKKKSKQAKSDSGRRQPLLGNKSSTGTGILPNDDHFVNLPESGQFGSHIQDAEVVRKEAQARLEKMQSAIRTLLECVGENPNREGLLSTPSRYAKALLFFTKGYQSRLDEIVNGALFNEGHQEMVLVKGIDIYSLCEHHLVPFTGKMHIAYVPKEAVIGLSKLPRIAEMFARRLQIQERLTKQVGEALMEVLRPQDVAVVMESCHMCMVMRGVEKPGTTTTTICTLGCFESIDMRRELLELIGL